MLGRSQFDVVLGTPFCASGFSPIGVEQSLRSRLSDVNLDPHWIKSGVKSGIKIRGTDCVATVFPLEVRKGESPCSDQDWNVRTDQGTI